MSLLLLRLHPVIVNFTKLTSVYLHCLFKNGYSGSKYLWIFTLSTDIRFLVVMDRGAILELVKLFADSL